MKRQTVPNSCHVNSSYRKIFVSIVRDLCEQDENTILDHNSLASFDTKSFGSRESNRHSPSKQYRTNPVSLHSPGCESIERAHRPALSKTESTKILTEELESSPLIEGEGTANLDTFSKSLREISADLAGLSSQPVRERSRDQLPLSLKSMSMHGDLRMKRRNKSDLPSSATSISKSTHRPSMGRERSTRTPRLERHCTLYGIDRPVLLAVTMLAVRVEKRDRTGGNLSPTLKNYAGFASSLITHMSTLILLVHNSWASRVQTL